MVAIVLGDGLFGGAGCFDGGGYDWSVSYDSGGTFESVDWAAFQDITSTTLAVGPNPYGDAVNLGVQNTNIVTNDNGADAIISVGGVGSPATLNYASAAQAAEADEGADVFGLGRLSVGAFPVDNDGIAYQPATINTPVQYGDFGEDLSAAAQDRLENTFPSRDAVRDTIVSDYAGIAVEAEAARGEIVRGAVATELAFQSGTTTERLVGPGIDGTSTTVDVTDTDQTYYERIIATANASASRLPAAVTQFEQGVPDPLQFGFDLNTNTFASNEDAELYAQARVTQIESVINRGIDLAIQGYQFQGAILGQNVDTFTIQNEDGTVQVLPYTRNALVSDILADPEARAAVQTALAQAGGDVNAADLRVSNIEALITSRLDAAVTTNRGELTAPETPEQRRAAQLEQEQIEAIARANALWDSIRTVNGLRGFSQLDGGGGGEPSEFEPVNDGDTFIDGEPGYFDDTNIVSDAQAVELPAVVVTASREDVTRLEALDQLIGDLDIDWSSADPRRKVNAAVLAQELIDTNGYGQGLDREQLELLQPIVQSAPNYAAYISAKIAVLSEDIWALSTDTATYNERRDAANDFYFALTAEERSLIANTEAGRLLNQWRGNISDFAAGSDFRNVPFTAESVRGITESIEKNLERWGDIETPGGRNIGQVGSIELIRDFPELVYFNDQGDAFFITGKPLDQLTSQDLLTFTNDLKTSLGQSSTTTIPAADTDAVLTGNDTPISSLPSALPSVNVELPSITEVAPITYQSVFNSNTGGFDVVGSDGKVLASNLTAAEATAEAKQANASQQATQPAEAPPAETATRDEPRRFRFAAAAVPFAAVAVSAVSAADSLIEGEEIVSTASAVSDPVTTSAVSAAASLIEGEDIVSTAEDVDTDPNVSPDGEQDDPVDVNDDTTTVTSDPYAADDERPADDDTELREPEDVDPDVDPQADYRGTPYDDEGNLNPGWAINEETGEPYYKGPDYIDPSTLAAAERDRNAFLESAVGQAARNRARQQAVIEAQRKQANEGDWRVKLRLAGGSQYLYNDPNVASDGILYPLKVTDGVIFPYTPAISTVYGANYSSYDLTHSNLRGYFYQNSYVDEITISAAFTAQDTSEANYLLAVIHFFRSVTKMFYGQDGDRGQPPPLVFLQGLGEFQFNLHPCVVRSFNYSLPVDVDYIRARSVNINGTNLLARRDRQTLAGGFDFLSSIRLESAGLKPGGLVPPPAPPTLGTAQPTYVPTRMEINLTLLPIQSREQVSQQFSLGQFANGDLIKAGFW